MGCGKLVTTIESEEEKIELYLLSPATTEMSLKENFEKWKEENKDTIESCQKTMCAKPGDIGAIFKLQNYIYDYEFKETGSCHCKELEADIGEKHYEDDGNKVLDVIEHDKVVGHIKIPSFCIDDDCIGGPLTEDACQMRRKNKLCSLARSVAIERAEWLQNFENKAADKSNYFLLSTTEELYTYEYYLDNEFQSQVDAAACSKGDCSYLPYKKIHLYNTILVEKPPEAPPESTGVLLCLTGHTEDFKQADNYEEYYKDWTPKQVKIKWGEEYQIEMPFEPVQLSLSDEKDCTEGTFGNQGQEWYCAKQEGGCDLYEYYIFTVLDYTYD